MGKFQRSVAATPSSVSPAREFSYFAGRTLVLSGLPGVGKTHALRQLALRGAAVIDLEGLAGHRGSAFGAIDGIRQPTHREFQRRVLDELARVRPDDTLWIENEGAFIGSVGLPSIVQHLLDRSPHVLLQSTRACRIMRLMRDYGALGQADMLRAIKRLRPRVGIDACDSAARAIRVGDRIAAIDALLPYYDTAYERRLRTANVVVDGDESDVAERLLQLLPAIPDVGERPLGDERARASPLRGVPVE